MALTPEERALIAGEEEDGGIYEDADPERLKAYKEYIFYYYQPPSPLTKPGLLSLPQIVDQIRHWIKEGSFKAPTFEEWSAENPVTPGTEGGKRLTRQEFYDLKYSDTGVDTYEAIIYDPESMDKGLLPTDLPAGNKWEWTTEPGQKGMWVETGAKAEDDIGLAEGVGSFVDENGILWSYRTDKDDNVIPGSYEEVKVNEEPAPTLPPGAMTDYEKWVTEQAGVTTPATEYEQGALELQQRKQDWEEKQYGMLSAWEQEQTSYNQRQQELDALRFQWEQEQHGTLSAWQEQQLAEAREDNERDWQEFQLTFQSQQQQSEWERAYGEQQQQMAHQQQSWEQAQYSADKAREDYFLQTTQPWMLPMMPQDYEGMQATVGMPTGYTPTELPQMQPYQPLPLFEPIEPGIRGETYYGNQPTPMGQQAGQEQYLTPSWLSGEPTNGLSAEQPLPPAYSPTPVPGSPDLSYVNRQVPPSTQPVTQPTAQTGNTLNSRSNMTTEQSARVTELQGIYPDEPWKVTAAMQAEGISTRNPYYTGSLEGRQQGMYEQDIRSLARRGMAGQDTSGRSGFIGEIHGKTPEEMQMDLEKLSWYAKPMQQGGWITKPTVAKLGEKEPELVTPLSKIRERFDMSGLSRAQPRGWLGGGNSSHRYGTQPTGNTHGLSASRQGESTSQSPYPVGSRAAEAFKGYNPYGQPVFGSGRYAASQTPPITSGQTTQPTNWLGTPQGEPPGGSMIGLSNPSRQYQARMGPTALNQYYQYMQAQQGIPPEELAWRLSNVAPPGGTNTGLNYTR